jgi:hypothetical protein
MLLSYSFMSATIPALKGFISGFITGGMGYTGDMSTSGGGSGNGNSYKMLRLDSKGKAVAEGLVPRGYPNSAVYVSSIPFGAEGGQESRSRRATGENESIASESSQRIIIRKERGATRD